MAGLYVHIPFCKTRCHYCDFYKTTDKTGEEQFVRALKKEIETKIPWFSGETIETVYFGGGTPSYLGIQNLIAILDALSHAFTLSENAEVTLEVNPDDVTDAWLNTIVTHTPVNRISMGVQSFRDKDLSLMNRRHTAYEAMQSLERIFSSGLTNVSIDLIYGIPGLDNQAWLDNLTQAFSFPVKHLSAYHLTFEQGTRFYQWQQQKKLLPVHEELSVEQFEMLLQFVRDKGFEQYEISNFSLRGFYSQHNLNYWRGIPYMGFGPSAHSFTGNKRQWNVASLTRYIKALNSGMPFYEEEVIDEATQYNDMIVTGLRTKWGISVDDVHPRYRTYLQQEARPYVQNGQLAFHKNALRITEKGLFISDRIMSDLMYVGEEMRGVGI